VIFNGITILCIKVYDAVFKLAQTVHTLKIKAAVAFICLFICVSLYDMFAYLFPVYGLFNDVANNS
jgi:hypothetical protein